MSSEAGDGTTTPGPAVVPAPAPRLQLPPGAPAESAAQRRSRLALALVMVAAGSLHFVLPDAYARIVPRGLGDARAIVVASGLAEVAAGVLLAVPRTRRLGGWCTAVVLVAVLPANVQMARDATASGDTVAMVLTWTRLPLQVPLVLWALAHARRR